MGRDKALLPYRGGVLAQIVASRVASAAGSVTLVGNAEVYRSLGFPVISDQYPGEGPLGGILTALAHTGADWNLVVACDMPAVSVLFLDGLLAEAETTAADALVPAGPSGRPEPLCAVYHRRALPTLNRAFSSGERKVMGALAGMHTVRLPVTEMAPFDNVNSPEDWLDYAAG